MKATVGRIVHFYTATPPTKPGSSAGLNGQGNGPYPALVVQTFSGSDYANLSVVGWGHTWDEGSVSEWNGEGDPPGRYWVWPPREG